MFWNNNPISINELNKDPDVVIKIPLGLFTPLSGGSQSSVTSVNGKTGSVILTAQDVGADVQGSSQTVQNNVDTLAIVVDTKANANAVIQSLVLKADLIEGKIPEVQLPSYVDDVLNGTFVDDTTFNNPQGISYTPEDGKLYVDVNTNKTYRWSGVIYVAVGGGGVALGETSSTAHRGDHGKDAYNHSLSQGNPHGTTTLEVPENTNLYFKEQRVLDTTLKGLGTSEASKILATDSVIVALQKLQSSVDKNAWNWVNVSEIGTLVDATNGGMKFIEEGFVDGVGGIWFCLKDQTVYVKAMFKVIGGVSGTGQRLMTIFDPKYKPKFGENNTLVIRSNSGALTSGAGLNQLTFTFRNQVDGYYLASQ